MSSDFVLDGGCLCAQLRYSVSALPFAADYCHCRNCQKSTGTPVAAWMDFKTEQITWTGRLEITEYSSSEHTRRGFCKNCGSSLTYRDARHPEYFSLSIASLDDPEIVRPTYHIHTESQLSWFNVVDDCKRYPQGQ